VHPTPLKYCLFCNGSRAESVDNGKDGHLDSGGNTGGTESLMDPVVTPAWHTPPPLYPSNGTVDTCGTVENARMILEGDDHRRSMAKVQWAFGIV